MQQRNKAQQKTPRANRDERPFFVPGDRGGRPDESQYEARDEAEYEADEGEMPAGHRHTRTHDRTETRRSGQGKSH